MEHAELYDKIIEFYGKSNSVKKTAEELGTSVIKVRRVLITEGLWSSPTSRKIMELWEQNLSTKEIAEQLHYTEKNVQAFLPYTKGDYGRANRSTDSIRSKEYRERNQLSAEKQIGFGSEVSKDYMRSEQLSEIDTHHNGSRPVALKLHLEMNLDGCSAQEREVLRRYGKMQEAISRDIIVPADMTLHSLHYVIQKLFGWRNAHLHHYEFPKKVFEELTQGNFGKWCSLAGVYFRFPDAELDDLFWDDDYEPNMSVKSWLKSKYKGPYVYGGLGDYYYENQAKIQQLKKELPSFEVRPSFQDYMKYKGNLSALKQKTVALEDATIEEVRNSIEFGGDFTHLLERLTLMDFLYLPDDDYFLDPLEERIEFLENDLANSIKTWNSVLANIDEEYETFCLIAALSTTRMQAITDRLHYFYDYGDDWEVTIELSKAYYAEELSEEEKKELEAVLHSYAPVCMEADGLPVLDDVGGIHGYADFLLAIHREDDETERDSIRGWARTQGWTGRTIKPKNML